MTSILRRLSVILLLILSIVLLAGILIPQKGFDSEDGYQTLLESHPRLVSLLDMLGLTGIHSSPLWFILVALLTINITLCTLFRVAPLIRRFRPEAPSPSELINLNLPPPPTPLPQGSCPEPFDFTQDRLVEGEGVRRGSLFSLDSEHSPQELLARLRSRLISRRYRIWVDTPPPTPLPQGEGEKGKKIPPTPPFSKGGIREDVYSTKEKSLSFRAVKNRLAPFGSLIFHLSFIVFLIGGIISIKTKFVRNVILAEGQSLSSREIAEGKVRVPDLRMRVEKINPVYEGKSYLTDLSSRVKIYHDRKENDVTIKVNRPFTYKSMSILIKDFGITPLYILRDAKGKELDGAFVNLSVLGPGSEDHFPIAGTPYTAYVKFFPDYVLEEGEHSSRSHLPRNPAFQLEVKEGERIAFEGLIMRGEQASFDDFSLTFPRVRYWGRFTFIKDRGKSIIFAGFFIALIGLVWRLLFYRKEIVGLIAQHDKGSKLQVSWKSDLNPKLFAEEVKSLLQDIRGG